MKRTAVTLALLVATSAASAAPWTYRGTLNDGGAPANGTYDLRVTLLNSTRTATVYGPLTLYDVKVVAGNFVADVDFGRDLSAAPAMALKTEVQQGNSGFVALGEATLFDPKVALAGVCWDTEGNAGTNPASNFVGTTDNRALVLRVNNLRIGELKAQGTTSAYGDAPSITFGSSYNYAVGIGSTVSGGGASANGSGQISTSNRNRAFGDFSTVGGGIGNAVSGFGSTVIGGDGNAATGSYSTVEGGQGNCAGGDFSWVGGNNAKTRPYNSQNPMGACIGVPNSPIGDSGTFVWADDQGPTFTSTNRRQFLVRAENGMAINTNIPTTGAALTVNGNISVPASGEMTFGNITRQMLNLWGPNGYGIGVQNSRLYFRTGGTGGFSWFEGGVHDNAIDGPGAGGTLRMRLSNTGQLQTTTGTISTLSDARLKDHVADYTRALDQINALRPVSYHYRDAGNAAFQAEGTHLGFIAQEVEQVFPQWVSQGEDGYLMLSMRGFEAVAVRGMQELSAENSALSEKNSLLQSKLEQLQAQNKTFEDRLQALEARLQ